MSEQTLLKLPDNWAEVETGYPVVDEGTYLVRVSKMTEDEEGVVSGDLVILDDPTFTGRHLFPWYHLDTKPGLRLFKEFTEAIGVESDGNNLDLSRCVEKTVEVVVRHHEGEDKTYVNVVKHRPASRLESNQ